MYRYEVALWRRWPSLFPEWIEEVEEFSPQSAMYAAMRLHGLRFVEKAAVGLVKAGPDALPGSCTALQRFYYIVCPRLVEVSSDD
jgi:hypothetical protein